MNRLILRLSLSVVAGVVLLTGAPFAARAQHPYGLELTNRFPVVAGADTLRDAWAGGLNSASYSKIDLNTDGVDDLYVHDQTTQRHLTFIATNGPTGWYWRHEPAYESAFPTDFGMLYTTLRDFDGDGRPDLFAVHGAQFWALYRNVAWPGGVGLRFDLVEDTLRTHDVTWLSTSIYGQQAVEDFDGDGDPDILDFNLGSDFFSLYRNPGTTAAGPRFVQEFTWGNLLRCSGAGSACHSYSFPPTTSCRPVHA